MPPPVPPGSSQRMADAAVGFSAAGSSFAWLGTANEILTMIATFSAIIAAVFAARYHITARRRLLDEDDDEATDD